MKHICLVNEKSRAAVYGVGTYICQLTECVKRMDNVVLHLVTLKSEATEVEVIASNKYYEYSIPYRKIGHSDIYYRDIWYVLNSYLSKSITDDTIFHINFNHQYQLARYIKRDYPCCTIVLTIHYLSWCFKLSGNISLFKQLVHGRYVNSKYNDDMLEFKNDKEYFKFVDHIICLSKTTKEILIDDYDISNKKISLIYNGIQDEGKMLDNVEKKTLKGKLSFNVDDKIILFVGRLDPIKGVSALIEAFRVLISKNDNLHLVIVGDGNYSGYLQQCHSIWNKVTFTGFINKIDLYSLYQIADIGVIPSMHEQCSYVVIEMLMFNIPLVLTNAIGLDEVLDLDSNKVKIVEYENDVYISPSVLADTISNVLDEQVGIVYRDYYINKYTLDRMFLKMNQLYLNLFDSSNQG